ncbi:MAG TPA: hypothetical protein VNA12_08840 [Mycobacteriales bacterium]|nr:hypothetical protein [Mycobacteriales bacterium]
MSKRDFSHLPAQIDPASTVQEVEPYEAVEELRGVRHVSPYSPVAGIDEARLYAEIGTTARTDPRRRRIARVVAGCLLFGYVGSLLLTAILRR